MPPGFQAQVYQSGLVQPTALAVEPEGTVYVAERGGTVLALHPGSFPQLVVGGLDTPLGLAFKGTTLLIAISGGLQQFINGQLAPIALGLPVGRHQQDGLAVGAGGEIYMGSGSTCDVCSEPSQLSAAILRQSASGGPLTVYASGTRNPFGLAVDSATGALYATVNGQDDLGASEPADMLIKVEAGAFYGWPRCWPSYAAHAMSGSCQGVSSPIAYLPPHVSADGMAIYRGSSFPGTYQGIAFVAEWGANQGGPIGRKLVQVSLGGSAPGQVKTFASGFVHPIAVAVDARGALLVADYGSGDVYRIRWSGDA